MRNGPLSLLLAAAATLLLPSCGSSHLTSAANLGNGQGPSPAKTTPAISWAQPAAITAGTALGPAQLDATANVPGTFAYLPAADTVPEEGTQTLSVTFTPTDAADYTTATASVKLIVNAAVKQNPAIVWTQPAPITVGAALGPDQLNAHTSIAGTFAYSPAAGTVLAQGMQTLSVTFTPADTADYNTATATVPISVDAAENPGGLGSSDCASASATSGTYLYLSTGAFLQGNNQVQGFSVAADGSLTPVPGSPFTTPGLYPLGTVGTGSTLFGADGVSLYSLAIHPGGCVTLQNGMAFGGSATLQHPFDPMMNLFLDPTHSTLYSFDFIPEEDAYYASYDFDASTGQVSQTGATDNGFDKGPLAFSSDGRYAVTSGCQFRSGPGISEYQRNSDGTLTYLSAGSLPPEPQNAYWCPGGAAADHSGHFIVTVWPCQGDAFCQPIGPPQLAVYTIDASGNLITSSTVQNMATTVAAPGALYGFSPDDKYFAIAGYVGMDIFAWDSTHASFTHIVTIDNTQGTCSYQQDMCTGIPFGNLAWDSNDHLYTFLGNQLFVYTVTQSGVTQAPGSPHAVQNPHWVTVVQPMGRTRN